MVETTLERTSDFEIVGAGWRHHEPKEQTPTLRQRLKGKPILAAVILLNRKGKAGREPGSPSPD